MLGFVARLIVIAAVGLGGWIVGSVYPAPEALVQQVNPQALEQRAVARLSALDWAGLKKFLPEGQLSTLSDGALKDAAAAGGVIMVDRSAAPADGAEAPDAIAIAGASAPVNQAFESVLSLCPRMAVSNAPRADAAGKVIGYTPTVTVQGVAIARYPTKGACLSSAFGPRGGKQHKGVDYHAADGGPILAAANGVVVEMKYRDDFGNMVLIDHGKGVYTRYAHLASFQRGLAVGATVRGGDQIGLMGNTASYPVPIHLHYEVLTGDYANPKASFGLAAFNPFS